MLQLTLHSKQVGIGDESSFPVLDIGNGLRCLHPLFQQESRILITPQSFGLADSQGIDEAVDACRRYFDKTGRQLTFEYSLVAGVNDSDEDAAELSTLLSGLNCVVNLIPVNPIKERDFKPTDRSHAVKFKEKLEKSRINATIRREMGRDIDGACGQLRRRYVGEK